MKQLIKWGWPVLLGAALLIWGYTISPTPGPTAFFSPRAVSIQLGYALLVFGVILLLVLFMRRRNET